MSEKPLTPGPWAVHRRMKDCVTFVGRHGEENLFLQNVDGYFACQGPADARLISAAPDLMADLIVAAATLRRYEQSHRAKGTDDSTAKAEVNAALALRFEATIAKAIQ